MKALFVMSLIFLVFFSCVKKNEKEAHIIYRIGFGYIELSFDESGHAKAKAGRGNSIDEDVFLAESTTDSIEFQIKNSKMFFTKLGELKEKQVESANSYTRTQIYLNDSLYYDTRRYSSNFSDLYSIISHEIPDEYNLFKTKRFN
ncbi:hypothetical protein [Sphingobacterium thalpophilum]|uniref:hypothetical protein n=1 Tax=Sphingobacterium thalpophilum TaxID=259 RepID=UPI002D76BA56|nr:hypothetical protein [Sphingobacterium thalpophilum]